jgi:hypothetical protein
VHRCPPPCSRLSSVHGPPIMTPLPNPVPTFTRSDHTPSGIPALAAFQQCSTHSPIGQPRHPCPRMSFVAKPATRACPAACAYLTCRCSAEPLATTVVSLFPRLDKEHKEKSCDILTQGLIGLIEYSYHQSIPSFLEAHLQRTLGLSVLDLEQFQDG